MAAAVRFLIGTHIGTIYRFGRWGGRDKFETCAIVTQVPEQHWLSNPDECENLLHKKIDGAVDATCAIILIALMFKAANGAFHFLLFLFSRFENRFWGIPKLGDKGGRVLLELRKTERSCLPERFGNCEK